MLVLGDYHDNLLKYNVDKQTSEYLNMLLSLGFMPIITKPTRVTDHTTTLLDHIYMNTPERLTKSGLCLANIFGHLPVFCTMANTLPTNNEPRLITNDVNESITTIVGNLRAITDRHAPLCKA